MHDEKKLLEGIDEALDRQGLLEQDVPATQMDDLKLGEIISKAAVKIRKEYKLDLRTAYRLHTALMTTARGFMGVPSAAAGAALARRMEKIFGEAMEAAEIEEAVKPRADLGPQRPHRWPFIYLHGKAEDLLDTDVFYADVDVKRMGTGVFPVSLVGQPATAYIFNEAHGPGLVGYVVLANDKKANDEARAAMKSGMPTL